jgi:hypothetical protein
MGEKSSETYFDQLNQRWQTTLAEEAPISNRWVLGQKIDCVARMKHQNNKLRI